MVYRCGFRSGHQTSFSSFIPGWLVLLLQVKTQHRQNSVHGIWFLRQLHLPSHPLLHPHFIRCSTASGAGGFKHPTGEKWLEPASNVQPNATDAGKYGCFHQLSSKSWLCSVRAEYLSPVNQTLVEGFLLRLHDLSRGTSEALLLLCGFLIDTARKQNVRASASRISSTQDMNALKHQHLVLPENLPDTALALACRSMKTQQCRIALLS